jgi:ABC-type sugar transport system ATPase subunit
MLASQGGKTLVVFSSDIDELLTLCMRIYTMSEGRIVKEYLADTAEKADILTDILIKHPASSENGGRKTS